MIRCLRFGGHLPKLSFNTTSFKWFISYKLHEYGPIISRTVVWSPQYAPPPASGDLATQSFQLWRHNTLIVHWTLTPPTAAWWPWHLRSPRMSVTRVTVLRRYTETEDRRRYGWYSVMALSCLVTLTFDLLTSKCHGLPSCQFSACYALPFST